MKNIYLLLLLFVATALNAQTVTVNSLSDDGGTGTLRWAILQANGDPTINGIIFDAGLTGTITLTSDLPNISETLTITGPGTSVLSISGNNNYKMFKVNGSMTLTISALTLTQCGSVSQTGSIFYVSGSTLIADNILVTGNTNTESTPFYSNNAGSLISITNSTFSNNSTTLFGSAGGNTPDQTLDDSLYDNRIMVSGSTFTGNSGHIFSTERFVKIDNCTFTGNTNLLGYFRGLHRYQVINSRFNNNPGLNSSLFYFESDIAWGTYLGTLGDNHHLFDSNIFSGNNGTIVSPGTTNEQLKTTITNNTFTNNGSNWSGSPKVSSPNSIDNFITSVSHNLTNSTVTVIMSKPVFSALNSTGSLDVNDFQFSMANGNATLASTTPSSVSVTGNTYTLGIQINGVTTGKEILTVSPVANSIFDSSNNIATAFQKNYTAALSFLDSDNDGVSDFLDQCPNTPNTLFVNPSTGCPDSSEGIIWNGPDKIFSKTAYSDQNLRVNQDSITTGIFITSLAAARRNSLINISLESSSNSSISPIGTRWAKVSSLGLSISQIRALTFVSWNQATGSRANTQINQIFMVYLPAQKIYFYLKLLAFDETKGSFSYQRSTLANTAPTAITLNTSTITENSAIGSSVGNLSSTDTDAGDTHTYTLVSGNGDTDNASFEIVGNTIKVKEVFNFETKSSYSIRIRTTDAGNLTYDNTFTITVSNVNEAPSAIALSISSINENSAIGTAIGNLSSTDVDAGDTHAYTLVSGTGDTDNASFEIVGGTIKAKEVFNFETKSSYNIRVRTTDSGALTFDNAFTISVNDVDAIPPLISGPVGSAGAGNSNKTVLENTAFVHTFTANEPVTWNIVGGSDAAKFSINTNTGVLEFNNGPNFVGYNFAAINLNIGANWPETASIRLSKSLYPNLSNLEFIALGYQFMIQEPGIEAFVINYLDNSQTVIDYLTSKASVSGLYDKSPTSRDSSTTGQQAYIQSTQLVAAATILGSPNLLIDRSLPDYENPTDNNADNDYTLIVRAIDANNNASQQILTVSVAGVSEMIPTDINLSSIAVSENAATGSTVGSLTTTDADLGDTFVYTLVSGTGDTDNGSFSLTGISLKTSLVFDYESKMSYSIRIKSTDAGGLSFEKAFTISVSDINESPTNIVLSANSLNENAAIGTAIGNLISADVDADDTHTYTLVSGTGDTDNASFELVGSAIRVKEVFNFEAKSSYSIRVRSTDAGNLNYETTFTITVINVNEAPSAIALSTLNINENSAIGTVISNLSSTDTDAGDTQTYMLVSGAGDTNNTSFEITGNQLKAKEVFNFEVKSSYSIRVRTTDALGLNYETTFPIRVLNVNEAPSAIELSALSINENSAIGTIIGNLSSTDVDAGISHSYALVAGTGDTNNTSFEITGNQLKVKEVFNFEAKSSYSIRVRTTDGDNLNYETTFTITVNNVNEAPSAIALSTSSLNENSAIGTAFGILTSTDTDAGDTFVYTLVSGTGDTNNASFEFSGNQLMAKEVFNFETKSSYSIRVRTTDALGLNYESTFPITVINVNEAPSAIALSTSSLNENSAIGTVIGNLTSIDTDAGDTHSYTLVSGTGDTNNASFEFSGNQLKAKEVFNFEAKSSYSIRVRSSDAANLNFENTFTITVNNVNEAPSTIALSSTSINENSAIGTLIGNLSSTDVDAGDTHTYTLVSGTGDTNNASFVINNNELLVDQLFDFESKLSYSIRLRSTDAGGLAYERTLQINILDINDAPSKLSISKQNSYEENSIGDLIGSLSTSDQDVADTHTYKLVAGLGSSDNASFSISNNQLRAAQVFNFANKNSYTVLVRTTDKAGLSTEQQFTFSIARKPELTGTGNEKYTKNPVAPGLTPAISRGYSSQLNISGADIISYNWSPALGLSSTLTSNPVATPEKTTRYTVDVTNRFGSSTRLFITVEVADDYVVKATNIMTPNGDGENDTWVIENLSSYPNNVLKIMNRAGKIIYTKNGYANDWNGQYNGTDVPAGTYYYILTFDGGAGVKKGFISIVK
jgi:gliding motility-associated-like protein